MAESITRDEALARVARWHHEQQSNNDYAFEECPGRHMHEIAADRLLDLLGFPGPSVHVMVGVRYREQPGDGSAMLTQLLDFSVEPQVGDLIELVPTRYGPGGEQTVSAWHERVVGRWIHRSEEYSLEVWVDMEGYDLDELEKVMKAADEGERP